MTTEELTAMAERGHPLSDSQIRDLVFCGFELSLRIEKLEQQQKLIKKLLVQTAAERPGEHEPIPDSFGTAWTARASGCRAEVIFPTDTLKKQISAESPVLDKLSAIIPEQHWHQLFTEVSAWAPTEKFREKAAELLGPKPTEKVLRLVTTASSPKVLFREES
jgi:hypothetical protein